MISCQTHAQVISGNFNAFAQNEKKTLKNYTHLQFLLEFLEGTEYTIFSQTLIHLKLNITNATYKLQLKEGIRIF